MTSVILLVGIDLNVDPEISDDILMGVFSPNGVHEVAQDIVEQLNGIPVGRTGKLAVYIVSVIKCKSIKNIKRLSIDVSMIDSTSLLAL